MPLLTLARFIFSLLSLAILAAGGYLLWTWWEGEWFRAADGALIHVRHAWPLWAGAAVLLFSVGGRFLIGPLLARPDKTIPDFSRKNGFQCEGAAGAELYVEAHGPASAPVIIFTHGQGLDSTIWSGLRDELAGDYRIYMWDLPGLGKSKSREGLSIGNAAANLEAVIAKTGADRVVLVGHSLGGMIVQELAAADPRLFNEKVAGAVLLNTTHTNPLRTMILSGLAQALQKPVLEPMAHLTIWITPLAWISNWQSYLSGAAHIVNRLQFSTEVTRAQLHHAALLSTRNSPGAIEQGNLSMFHWRGLQPGVLPCPVLVIGGASDIVTKPEASATIAKSISSAQLNQVAKANHMTFCERPNEYAGLIAAFAARVGREKRVPA